VWEEPGFMNEEGAEVDAVVLSVAGDVDGGNGRK